MKSNHTEHGGCKWGLYGDTVSINPVLFQWDCSPMSRWLKTPTKRRKACIAPPCLLETLDTDTQDSKQIINDISGTGIILFTIYIYIHTYIYILIHTYIHIYIYMYILHYIYTHLYTYIYIYTYIYYIYIYILLVALYLYVKYNLARSAFQTFSF